MKLSLSAKYRPRILKDVYLQTEVSSYLRAVVSRPDDSIKYFFLSGGYGCGKTTLARAFANQLLKVDDCLKSPNYIEIDSSEKRIQEHFDDVKNLIFSETTGYRVVTIDECHLLAPDVSQKLLKILEDFVGNVFIFFCTTDAQLVPNPLKSRCLQFTLHGYTTQQCVVYAKQVLEKEGLSLSDRAIEIAALNSQGHIRDLLQQLDIIRFQGEDYFLKSYSTLWQGLDNFFYDFSKSRDDVMSVLLQYHAIQLKAYVSNYMLNNLVKGTGVEWKDKLYPRLVLPKIYNFYLKLLSQISESNSDEIYSFLYVFRDFLNSVRVK